MDVGVATGVGLGAAGIGTVAVLDRVIDVTAHDHHHVAYKVAGWPTRVLFGGAVALAGVGLLAGLHPDTREHRGTLLEVAAGVGAAYGATIAFRLGWGMAVAPVQRGWKPGMKALPRWRLDDVAANAIDRTRLMGRDPDLASWKLFDLVSRRQGHGPLVERADDFVDVLRVPGIRYG